MLSDFFEMDLTLLYMHFKLHINSVITFLALKYLARKGLGNLALAFNVLEKKTCFFLLFIEKPLTLDQKYFKMKRKNKVLDVIKDKLVKYGVTKDQENERVSFFD